MLRLIFVLMIIVAGTYFAAQSAFYGLLFYLWNAYFRPDDWTYGGVLVPFRMSLIIGAYVVIRTIFSMPNWKINFRTALIWLFFAQTVVGTFTSEQPDLSWAFIQDFVKVLLITYLIIVIVTDRKQFRTVLVVIALSLSFELAKQGWVNLFRAPGARNDNPIVFLGDNNGVAMGCMMLLPILGALAQTTSKRWERHMHRFLAVGVLLRGISTYSRGGFLGAAALGVIMFVRAEKKIRMALAIAVLGIFVWNLMPQDFWDRMDTINVEDESQRDASAAGRLHFWQVAVDMANAKPLTGVGVAAYNRAYLDYNTDERFDKERAAHSNWFGVLGELGYPGLFLFIANIAFAFWSNWQTTRLARNRPELRDLRIYGNALISTLVVYCVCGTFLSQHYSEMAWHMFGLSTALHLIALDESRTAATQTRAVRVA